MARQSTCITQDSDIYCPCDNRPMNKNFKNNQNSKVKRTLNISINNKNSEDGQGSQLGKTFY